MSTSIVILSGEKILAESESVIIVPEKSIEEAGYIKMFTVKDGAHAKHEYHAMAQMAYFQYQDDELDIHEIDEPVAASYDEERVDLDSGMVLCRNGNGEFLVFMHKNLNRKKLLEAVYRYCTRWVRLDI
ncbi:MAG: hypothetical protein JRC87_07320 [Deltaproteobacteria bacterium]|nr:hypothetical protein [Deltaproteobacteria bacterium]MBW2659383.1 hypothetical protein [Deltaproteobacteria bacterium]